MKEYRHTPVECLGESLSGRFKRSCKTRQILYYQLQETLLTVISVLRQNKKVKVWLDLGREPAALTKSLLLLEQYSLVLHQTWSHHLLFSKLVTTHGVGNLEKLKI